MTCHEKYVFPGIAAIGDDNNFPSQRFCKKTPGHYLPAYAYRVQGLRFMRINCAPFRWAPKISHFHYAVCVFVTAQCCGRVCCTFVLCYHSGVTPVLPLLIACVWRFTPDPTHHLGHVHMYQKNLFFPPSSLASFQEYSHTKGSAENDSTSCSSYSRPIGGAYNSPKMEKKRWSMCIKLARCKPVVLNRWGVHFPREVWVGYRMGGKKKLKKKKKYHENSNHVEIQVAGLL